MAEETEQQQDERKSGINPDYQLPQDALIPYNVINPNGAPLQFGQNATGAATAPAPQVSAPQAAEAAKVAPAAPQGATTPLITDAGTAPKPPAAPNPAAPVPYAKAVQETNPWAGLNAKISPLVKPDFSNGIKSGIGTTLKDALKILGHAGVAAGAGAEGMSKDYPQIAAGREAAAKEIMDQPLKWAANQQEAQKNLIDLTKAQTEAYKTLHPGFKDFKTDDAGNIWGVREDGTMSQLQPGGTGTGTQPVETTSATPSKAPVGFAAPPATPGAQTAPVQQPTAPPPGTGKFGGAVAGDKQPYPNYNPKDFAANLKTSFPGANGLTEGQINNITSELGPNPSIADVRIADQKAQAQANFNQNQAGIAAQREQAAAQRAETNQRAIQAAQERNDTQGMKPAIAVMKDGQRVAGSVALLKGMDIRPGSVTTDAKDIDDRSYANMSKMTDDMADYLRSSSGLSAEQRDLINKISAKYDGHVPYMVNGEYVNQMLDKEDYEKLSKLGGNGVATMVALQRLAEDSFTFMRSVQGVAGMRGQEAAKSTRDNMPAPQKDPAANVESARAFLKTLQKYEHDLPMQVSDNPINWKQF